MTFAQRVLAQILIIGALLTALWIMNVQRQAANARTAAALTSLRQAVEGHERAVQQLESTTHQAVTQYQELQHQYQQQNALSSAIRTRILQLESFQREDQTYRLWADQPLPDAVVRLRERPAFTGADDYLDWLSPGDTLPTASDGSAAEQPAAR